MFIEVKIENAEVLSRQLAAIGGDKGKEIIGQSIQTSLEPTLAASKSNAVGMVGGNMGGWIASALHIKPFKRKRKGMVGFNVAIHKSYNSFFQYLTRLGLQHYIPSAIEYGHAKRDKAIEHRAAKLASIDTQIEYGTDKVPAIPFMRKAADTTLPKAVDIFTKEFTKRLENIK